MLLKTHYLYFLLLIYSNTNILNKFFKQFTILNFKQITNHIVINNADSIFFFSMEYVQL